VEGDLSLLSKLLLFLDIKIYRPINGFASVKNADISSEYLAQHSICPNTRCGIINFLDSWQE
jgi:hypothetical protein